MQLDDSAGSFEIEDFDPLNLNARPIPEKLYPTPLTSTTTSSNVFMPKQQNPSVNHTRPSNNDDLKLLSLYGLDDFLPQSPSTSSVKTTHWTTFDWRSEILRKFFAFCYLYKYYFVIIFVAAIVCDCNTLFVSSILDFFLDFQNSRFWAAIFVE